MSPIALQFVCCSDEALIPTPTLKCNVFLNMEYHAVSSETSNSIGINCELSLFAEFLSLVECSKSKTYDSNQALDQSSIFIW